MNNIFFFALLLGLFGQSCAKSEGKFYRADHKYVTYVGRVDAGQPRFWASGAYVVINFSGSEFRASINDENRYGTVLNYLEVQVDDQPAYRIKLGRKTNDLVLASKLSKGKHRIIICKNTEGENGYIEFVGFNCEALLPPSPLPKRKMEFIGDSITCGFGADESDHSCGDKNANWYDQHNAWFAYGPLTARKLDAQWHLTSVSGIGLVHSCCEKKILMPEVYDKVNLSENKIDWDFQKYQPDVVTVCLGQNDGVQDSVKFCGAYVAFAQKLRDHYPKAKLIFLSSPMADATLKAALVKYITAVKQELNRTGEYNLGSYFFSKQSHLGCGSHPSLTEQREISNELTAYVKQLMHW